MQVTLTVIGGPHDKAEFTSDRPFVVGRNRRSDFHLSLKDPKISRFHFIVDIKPRDCAIVELDSKNGTKLNEQDVKGRAALKDGDRIQSGNTLLKVSIDPGRETPKGTMPYAVIADDSAPDVPGYHLVRRLGEGATGVVYLAFDQARRSLVALKLIQPELAANAAYMARIGRERLIHMQLEQSHIAKLRDFQGDGDQPYFVMEYIKGQTALALLRNSPRGRLPLDRAVRLICQALDGLAYLHNAGMIHRDIKPSNLMIAEVDGRDLVKIVDFGIAAFLITTDRTRLTKTHAELGTPGFMAPEQRHDSAKVGPEADVYSVGATLFALLTGKPPNALPPDKTGDADPFLAPPPLAIEGLRPDLPRDLILLIHRTLDKDPKNRPKARELQELLEEWSDAPA